QTEVTNDIARVSCTCWKKDGSDRCKCTRLRREMDGRTRELQDPRGACRDIGWRCWCIQGLGGCGMASPFRSSGTDRTDGLTYSLYRVWNIRRHPASGGTAQLDVHRGYQQRP